MYLILVESWKRSTFIFLREEQRTQNPRLYALKRRENPIKHRNKRKPSNVVKHRALHVQSSSTKQVLNVNAFSLPRNIVRKDVFLLLIINKNVIFPRGLRKIKLLLIVVDTVQVSFKKKKKKTVKFSLK